MQDLTLLTVHFAAIRSNALRTVIVAFILFASGCGTTHPPQPEPDQISYLTALCADPQRLVISKTAAGVEEIAVWPEKGPRDTYGNDLFFGRKKSSGFLTGRNGGRYGGYKRVVLQHSDKSGSDLRYRVVYTTVITGAKFGARDILGMKIEIHDIESGEKIAERTDYTVSLNYGLARGCDFYKKPALDSFREQGLEFIHSVLNPPPSVEIIVKEKVPVSWLGYTIDMDKIRFATTLEVNLPDRNAKIAEDSNPYVRAELMYKSDAMSTWATGRALRFFQPTRDILVPQDTGIDVQFLDGTRNGDHYIVVMRLNDTARLLIRKFSLEGELISQEVIGYPDSLRPVAYSRGLGGMVVEPDGYRLKLRLKTLDDGREKDVVLAIPR